MAEEKAKRVRTDAHRKADRVYAEKHKTVCISITFKTEPDKIIAEAIRQYVADTGQTSNKYIKDLITQDLTEKGYLK